MSKEWDPRNVFDVFGSESARRILALAAERPRSAEELAESLQVSQPTVYRRLDVLQDYDLVREDTRLDDEGNHYKAYETALERATFEVQSGEFVVDLEFVHDPLDEVDDDYDFAE